MRFGWGSGRREGSVAVPGGEWVVVCGGAAGEDVARVGDVERAFGEAGFFDGVDVSGLQREGHGLGKVDAGVFKMAVDEERDRDEAGGGGLGEVAGPLVDGDGAGDFFRRRDAVHLSMERRRLQQRHEERRQQERATYGKALEHVSIRRETARERFGVVFGYRLRRGAGYSDAGVIPTKFQSGK